MVWEIAVSQRTHKSLIEMGRFVSAFGRQSQGK